MASPQTVLMPTSGDGTLSYGGNGYTGTVYAVLEGGAGSVKYNTNGGQPTTVLPQGESQLSIGPNQLTFAWSGGNFKLAFWV